MSAVMSIEIKSTRRNGVPAEVHALLILWGNFTRRAGGIGPAGLPTESPFVKSALYGKLGIPQESNVRVDEGMPALVEWIDKIVQQMPIDLREVIEAKYKPLLTKESNEISFDQMARNCGMSSSSFRNRLESAQWYVYARMYP